MKEEDFIALVERLEVYEREHPAAYRLRVALLAALGYLTLFGVLGLTLLFLAFVTYGGRFNFLMIEILVLSLFISALIIRSLWITFKAPEGQELTYDDAPRLFDLLKEVRIATGGPRLHKVLLDPRFNARMLQQPRVATFGYRNYLQIGLPLLRALSPEEMRAVLVHEYGHLSGNHGRFYSWIYRIRQTWLQFLERMQQHRREFPMFQRFFEWYAPYFESYSFVLSRAHEYEADRCAVAASGKETCARALIKMELKDKFINEEFWPKLHGRADTQPEPPAEGFSEMLQSLQDPVPREKAALWFADLLTERHDYHDSHPALADRIAAMGYADVRQTANIESFVIPEDDQAGADHYFLAHVPAKFIEQQNNLWKEELSETWKARYEFVVEADKALTEFEKQANTTELTIEERWQRADLVCCKEGPVAAMPLLQEVLELAPDHFLANFRLGDALLRLGDEAGIKRLEAAMENDVHLIPAGCDLIAEFLTARERHEEADRYRNCAGNYFDELERARHERTNFSTRDTFEPHGLTGEELAELREQLATFPLSSAYLVRKVCEHFPEEPAFVLGIIVRRLVGLQSNSRDQAVVDQMANTLSIQGYTYIIALEHEFKSLRKVFKQIEGAEIYRAS